jgi:uncharacterized LabA/DUF88 family protein/cold shock CspA family protein
MSHSARQLTRIGVFYDGNYFDRVSKYYNHQHEKKAWISISGLHAYICFAVAQGENVEFNNCQVVDAHYFRGRFSAHKSKEKGEQALFYDRVIDDILMQENVTTHYLPMNFAGKEKGIDVWLALEAFELTILKQFDVVVLVASDSDYIPLVRKLKTRGVRAMAVSWSFRMTDDARPERPSQMLHKEVSYSLMMSDVIDKMDSSVDPEREVLSTLFKRPRDRRPIAGAAESDWKTATIESLMDKYGHLRADHDSPQLYFYYSALIDADPDDLEVGMEVTYQEGKGQKGSYAKKVRTAS